MSIRSGKSGSETNCNCVEETSSWNDRTVSPELWSVHQRTLADRTNNFAEASHRRLQQAFSCAHPTIRKFIDVLRREQKSRDADMARCIAGDDPQPKARRYKNADARILQMVRNYHPVNQGDLFRLNLHHEYPAQPVIDFLMGISYNYQMDQ